MAHVRRRLSRAPEPDRRGDAPAVAPRRAERGESGRRGSGGAHRAAECATSRTRSLCVCADGALIAGFVDDERGRAAALREACARAGGDALGELTSRPKRLLHVTLGRLLGRAEGLRPEQAAAIVAAVRAFHATPLREQNGTDDDEPQAFALRSVALMRDSVWWMTRCEEFKSWELAEG